MGGTQFGERFLISRLSLPDESFGWRVGDKIKSLNVNTVNTDTTDGTDGTDGTDTTDVTVFTTTSNITTTTLRH